METQKVVKVSYQRSCQTLYNKIYFFTHFFNFGVIYLLNTTMLVDITQNNDSVTVSYVNSDGKISIKNFNVFKLCGGFYEL